MYLPAVFSDPWIRWKARLAHLDLDRFQIRLARTSQEYQDAFRLVHIGYVFQGIEPLKPVDLRMTEQHVLAEAIVLVAYERDQLVGTISVTRDSGAGLPLDKDYPDELDLLRRRGARLSEIGSLAVVRRCWHSTLMPLLGMAAARVGYRVHGSTHHVIGVHPRAEPLYRALWKFERLGSTRAHADLAAPVMGLVQEREAAITHMRRHFAHPLRQDPSILACDYSTGDCIPKGLYLPEDVREADWARFRMPREVFRELFIERSNRLAELSEPTFRRLREQRTEETVGVKSEVSPMAPPRGVGGASYEHH